MKTRKIDITFQVYTSGDFRITYPEITDFDRMYLLQTTDQDKFEAEQIIIDFFVL